METTVILTVMVVLGLVASFMFAREAHILRKKLIEKEIAIMNLKNELWQTRLSDSINKVQKKFKDFAESVNKVGISPKK